VTFDRYSARNKQERSAAFGRNQKIRAKYAKTPRAPRGNFGFLLMLIAEKSSWREKKENISIAASHPCDVDRSLRSC
jgi:hypothetical protein